MGKGVAHQLGRLLVWVRRQQVVGLTTAEVVLQDVLTALLNLGVAFLLGKRRLLGLWLGLGLMCLL